MSIAFHFENQNKGIIVKASGIADGKEFLEKMKESFSDEEVIRNYRYGINDFTQLEKFNISSHQIFSLAKLHIKASRINRNLVVGFAIKKPLIYGLVRIWEALAEATGWEVNIEETVPAIRDWVEEALARQEEVC